MDQRQAHWRSGHGQHMGEADICRLNRQCRSLAAKPAVQTFVGHIRNAAHQRGRTDPLMAHGRGTWDAIHGWCSGIEVHLPTKP